MNFFQQSYLHAMAQGNWNEAFGIAQSVLAETPVDAEWLNRMGYSALVGGQVAKALECFDAAVLADPYFTEALLNGAIVLAETGFYDESRARFEAAADMSLRLDKNLGKPAGFYRTFVKESLNAIENFCDIEDWQAAKVQLEQLLQLCDAFSVRLKLADVCMRLGQLNEATTHVERVAKSQLGGSFAVSLQIQLALRQNRLDDARELLATVGNHHSTTLSVLKQLIGFSENSSHDQQQGGHNAHNEFLA